MTDASKGAMHQPMAGRGTSNLDWWPKLLNLKPSHQFFECAYHRRGLDIHDLLGHPFVFARDHGIGYLLTKIAQAGIARAGFAVVKFGVFLTAVIQRGNVLSFVLPRT